MKTSGHRARRAAARSALALLSGLLLSGQTAPTEPRNDVVVTGERLSPEEAERRANAYVRRTGVAAGERAAARWRDPVCPVVLGVAPEVAAFVERRVREVATAMGAPVAAQGCTPNATVGFVADVGAVARGLLAREPIDPTDLTPEERRALLKGAAPVRWWHLTELTSRDGDRPFDGALALRSDSNLSTLTVRALRSATVLVDGNRAAGVKLDAVADLVAFVTLAEVRVGAGPYPDSILGLFDGADRAGRMTEWDQRFLRALYRLPLDRRARLQRSTLAGALTD